MSKASNKGVDYGKFDPYFIEQVKGVIAEADRHKYSVSRVYGAYNKAHGKNDKPQTCSSCLRNRVRELRKWYEGYTKFEAEQKKGETIVEAFVDLGTDEGDTHVEAEVTGEPIKDVEPQYSDPVAPGFVAPALGVIRIPLTEGLPIDFTPNKDNAEKGKVKYADGTAVKAGTYATATGDEIAVQPGGKATLKNNDLL